MYKLRYNRGLWQLQIEALLDICVMDTDAQTYVNRTVDAVLASAEQEKRKILFVYYVVLVVDL